LVGRKTDLIKAGGFNVYPREIEEVLCRHPKIREAAAVGVADPYQGEAVVAVVTLRAWQTATEQEIIEYCRENLAAFKAPQHIEFRDALPRSPTGKLLRRQLRSEMAEKRSQANYGRKSVP
jgi:long-chain acyl-CoA synthetase